MKGHEASRAPAQQVDFRNLFRDLRVILKAGGAEPQQSLEAIVALLAAHFRSDVCSLYQLDAARGALLLRATKGLRPEAVGRTALGLGEGLVGTVAETRRLLALENAQADARFVFRPETGEEIYRSFLGIPLVRAQILLGVLVIQHREPRRYGEAEIEDCETVAQFLSERLHQLPSETPAVDPAGPRNTLRLSAVPLSVGLAMGKVALFLKDIVIERWQADNPASELIRLKAALQELEESLEALLHLPQAKGDPDMRELLEADLMLARDRGWKESIESAIGRGLSAEAAVQRVREDLRARMKAVTNDYIRERLLDLDELSHRLLAKLTGQDSAVATGTLSQDSILVCRSLGTPDLLQIDREHLAGLVVVDATPSSHLAIIANSLKIPTLGQVPAALTELGDGDRVVLDAVSGQLIVRPSASVAAQYEAHIAARQNQESRVLARTRGPCRSRDGVPLRVMANAGILLDLEEIARLDTDGIGLYRTEMAFLVRNRFPSVEEQARLYRRIYERIGDKPVVFRTLDVGSDKKLPYFEDHGRESNPALGWRAIRIGLDHPDLLSDQLRALLMAADGRPLRVMFPMISEVEEFVAARGLLISLLEEKVAGGGQAPARVEVGVMIEVPALLWDLERLLKLADFASVGTNDLFQFLTAADRNNPRTDKRFEALTPANLRLLTTIATAGLRLGKPVSVCGELAATVLGSVALAGCGFREFSVSPARIAPIKAALGSLDLRLVQERIQALSQSSGGCVRQEITALAAAFGVELDERVGLAPAPNRPLRKSGETGRI